MGLLLICAAVSVGYCLLKQFAKLDRPLVSFCGAVVIGVIVSGTGLYLIDLLCVRLAGDYFSATLVFLVIAGGYSFFANRNHNLISHFRTDAMMLRHDRAALWCIVLLLPFCIWLNWHTLNVTGSGDILVANGAWSDLMYHLSYVRSVSLGNNAPIQYPYFAHEPAHYHFMFDYFTGKVAQLGLDSVQALNLMSTLSLLSLLLLTFEFGRTVFKSTTTGVLGVVFLLFHSSLSVFGWMKDNLNRGLLQQILHKDGWLAGAEFEVWGIFNLNVFVNQRHFAIGLAVIVLLVLALIKVTEERTEHRAFTRPQTLSFMFWAIVVGCLPFWNALFAAIGLIFLAAFAVINYKHKELLTTLLLSAAVAGILAYPQLMAFRSGTSALAGYPRVHFGYALDRVSVTGFVLFYARVFGLKLLLMVASLFLIERKLRLYALIFVIPFVIANLLQLSSVLYDNNKLIFASVVFINCYAAYTLDLLLKKRQRAVSAAAIALIVMVTLAGLVDFFAVKNLKTATIADETSALKWWVAQKTAPKSVFLTNTFIPFADNAIEGITLAGRYLYVVHNCVSSSCNVEPRIENARKIYSFEGGKEAVSALLKAEGIDYIVVDEHVRNNSHLQLNERAFIENYKIAYKDETITVFAVS
jgi:hypothetical protein